jgi:hypothetical protein
VAEPRADDPLEAIAPKPILARPPIATNLDEARLLEHLEVTRRRRPGVREARGEVARRQLPAALGEEDEHLPPRLVREGEKDAVDVCERGLLHRADD